MTTEPLKPIADALTYEAARLESTFGLELGVVVTIDDRAGTVTARGDGLKLWGPRQILSTTLDRAGLPHDILMPSATIIVYPTMS